MTATVPPSPSPRRAIVRSTLQSAPPGYTVLENEVGAVTFLGDGAPDPDAGPPHAPQVLRRPDAVILLVSPTLAVARVGEAFTAAREANAEPKARALALKAQLRELSAGHRFSFVLVDLVASRVFAASTALSSPLALGHEADGTLLVTCTRSGAKAATAWPPRWKLPGRGGRARGSGGKLAHQYGKSPGSSTTPATPDRGRSSPRVDGTLAKSLARGVLHALRREFR